MASSKKKSSDSNSITKAPALKVTSLATPKRNGNKFETSWKVPSDATSSKKNNRFTSIKVEWTLDASKRVKKQPTKKVGDAKNESKDKSDVVKEATYSNERQTSSSISITRKNWYPFTFKVKTGGKTKKWYRELIGVRIAVWGVNARGKGPKNTSSTLKMGLPAAPQLSSPTINAETGRVNCKITKGKSTDKNEVYDTKYSLWWRTNKANGKWKSALGENAKSKTFTGDSQNVSFDFADYHKMDYNDWAEFRWAAQSRGLRGPNPSGSLSPKASKKNRVTTVKTKYVSYPAQVTIASITTSGTANSLVHVGITVKRDAHHPIDKIVLQRLKNFESRTSPAAAAIASGWEDVSNATDNSTLSGLNDQYNNATSDPGTYTWYRVVTYHDDLVRYSEAKQAAKLNKPAKITPTGADDEVYILEATPNPDTGTSIKVILGWNKTNSNGTTFDATGTQLTWTENSDGWESTKEPSSFNVTWKTSSSSRPYPAYDYNASVTIYDLSPNTKYYIRARAYLEGEDGTTYGKWLPSKIPGMDNSTVDIITSIIPAAVTLRGPVQIGSGGNLALSWVLGADATQKSFYVMLDKCEVMLPGAENAFEPIEVTQVVTETETTALSTTVSWDNWPETLREYVEGRKASAKLTLSVWCNIAGSYVQSDSWVVSIANAPLLALSCDDVLTEQPASFVIQTDQTGLQLHAKILAEGISTAAPDGDRRQYENEVIWSDLVTPGFAIVQHQYNSGGWAQDGAFGTLLTSKIATELTGSETWEGRILGIIGLETITIGFSELYKAIQGGEPSSETNVKEYFQSLIEQKSGEVQTDILRVGAGGTATRGMSVGLYDFESGAEIVIPAGTKFAEIHAGYGYAPMRVTSATDCTYDLPNGEGTGNWEDVGTIDPIVNLYNEEDIVFTVPATEGVVSTLATMTMEGVESTPVSQSSSSLGTSIGYSLLKWTYSVTVKLSQRDDDRRPYLVVEHTMNVTSGYAFDEYVLTANCYLPSLSGPKAVKSYLQYDSSTKTLTVLHNGATATVPFALESYNSDMPYSATITAPESLALIDNGTYTIQAQLIDNEHSTRSTVEETQFTVNWSRKAEPAGNGTRVYTLPDIYQARISIGKPDNWVKSDLADLYRVTPDGAYLIASGVPFDSEVIDRFTPFSKFANLRYRVATRTVDGSVTWRDVGYNLYSATMRFDWLGKSLELPFDIKHSDSYTKGFENRKHLDGYDGYFDEYGTSRNASLSTDLIKLEDPEDKELVKQLARDAAPVFVRTPDGSAFTANVNVTNYSYEFNNPIVSISLSAEETRLTPEFMVARDDMPTLPETEDDTVEEESIEVPPAQDPVVLSDDTMVYEGETYYTYNASTGVYTVVVPEGDENPFELGWYESAPAGDDDTDVVEEENLENLEDYNDLYFGGGE